MNANKTTYLAVDRGVYLAVRKAVGAVYWAVYRPVDRAVSNAVDRSVYWAVRRDPSHPALATFLAAVGAETT